MATPTEEAAQQTQETQRGQQTQQAQQAQQEAVRTIVHGFLDWTGKGGTPPTEEKTSKE